MENKIRVTEEMVVNNPHLVLNSEIGGGSDCPLPKPTTPPAGYSYNSTVYCENGEWKWVNGSIA